MTSDKLSGVRHRSVRFSPSGERGIKERDFPSLESLSSLVIIISFFRYSSLFILHSSFFILHYSLTIKGKVSFEGSVVIRFVKA